MTGSSGEDPPPGRRHDQALVELPDRWQVIEPVEPAADTADSLDAERVAAGPGEVQRAGRDLARLLRLTRQGPRRGEVGEDDDLLAHVLRVVEGGDQHRHGLVALSEQDVADPLVAGQARLTPYRQEPVRTEETRWALLGVRGGVGVLGRAEVAAGAGSVADGGPLLGQPCRQPGSGQR